MDTATVRALGFILACNARVEGMRAANLHAERTDAPLYDEQAFMAEAAQMESIAHELQS